MWWFKAYSTLVQTYTYDLFFLISSNNPALHSNSLYIWFEHYTHKVAGSRLFDHKKPSAMPSCLSVVASCFFFFKFTFCYFFTVCNFHKLFFIVEKGQGLYCIHCATGERVHLDLFPFFFNCWGGKRAEVNVFFSPSLEMWKELLPQYLILKKNM